MLNSGMDTMKCWKWAMEAELIGYFHGGGNVLLERKGSRQSMSGDDSKKDSMRLGMVGCGFLHVINMRKLIVLGRRERCLLKTNIVQGVDRSRHVERQAGGFCLGAIKRILRE